MTDITGWSEPYLGLNQYWNQYEDLRNHTLSLGERNYEILLDGVILTVIGTKKYTDFCHNFSTGLQPVRTARGRRKKNQEEGEACY